MGLSYENLDEATRAFMVQEIELDVSSGSLYFSPWLSPRGLIDWPELLLEAARNGSDASLAQALQLAGRINRTAERRKPKGGFTTYTVPATAPDTMAEGEFNRFYVRAMCRRATSEHRALEVYRAKPVMTPRPGSEEKIGSLVDAEAVLRDLRSSAGVEPALGLPPGPNSGLCVRFPPG